MDFPGISVIIPSFNQGQFIERTLLSIFKQEYGGKVQIIVSDGGSTDNTVEILKKYDKRIIWWSEKDTGYAEAVNKGFKQATGGICAIQSSDDYYLKDAFLSIIESFRTHPGASLICGREALQNSDGNVFGGYILPEVITPRSFIMDYPFPGIFQHTTFFRSEYFEKSKGLRRKFDMCADADLFYRLLHFANGYFLDKYVAVYQRHAAQRTQTQTLKFESQLLDMVLNCRNDSEYNRFYSVSEEDFFQFKAFVNLFYLQYADPEKAIWQAAEVVKDSEMDARTKNLAKQILDRMVIEKGKPLPEAVAKTGRIITHLYRKYIFGKKIGSPSSNSVSFQEEIKQDWWKS